MKLLKWVFILLIGISAHLFAEHWIADLGNGRYRNPILFADYSDPDVVRVGDDFYMVASSFNCMPGLPVLHSKDLVNWTITGHVYDKLPFEKFDKPAHGHGCWAPAIRFHEGRFYVYFCTPHTGLFMASADDPAGTWELHQVASVEMWEDPCPFWDDDGNAYLVRSKLRGDILYLHRMSPDGRTLMDNGKIIFRDEKNQPTIEGPKFLKKDGYYYILAPAGGVPRGWQTVLRSRNIDGPYETRVVLHQGNTEINGPHQGGLVALESGEWWFLHFQDRGPYGRIVHLQPVLWQDDWPLTGEDVNGDGIGEPVLEWQKPDVGREHPVCIPQMSDEFDSGLLGLQWQWHANPKAAWYSLTENPDCLRLYSVQNLTQDGNFWFVPNLLLQKFPAPSFSTSTRMTASLDLAGERSGLVVMGETWAYLAMTKTEDGIQLGMYNGQFERALDATQLIESVPVEDASCTMRAEIHDQAVCTFSYSLNEEDFVPIGKPFKARKGRWIGAKVGIFHINPNIKESQGFTDFDWFQID